MTARTWIGADAFAFAVPAIERSDRCCRCSGLRIDIAFGYSAARFMPAKCGMTSFEKSVMERSASS